MPSPSQLVRVFGPLLRECGYDGARLATGYEVNKKIYPLVGFASNPWDSDSACIAVVEANGAPLDAAKACRDLGAPIVWVRNNGTVDWWTQHAVGPTRRDSKPIEQFHTLVQQEKARLHPTSVYRAKTLGRLAKDKQLEFVDVGLMPLLRAEAGEKLGGLVEAMTRDTLEALGQTTPSKKTLRRVFTDVFRLLAGKILRDKRVGDFSTLDLDDVSSVLSSVAVHYGAVQTDAKPNRQWKAALKHAANRISGFGDVRVVSPESLAYVYEHALVSKELRKKLGIHATPPWLVHYIVWQLYDWIREIPVEERHVFEPGCGHAPFLLAMMRLLRLEKEGESEAKTHTYLQQHIHGVEVDEFAREIARLSLTLADIPNPNGWDLRPSDMYASNELMAEAKRCRILLSNPPYEPFGDAEKKRYRQAGFPVRHKKAVELLDRVIDRLEPGAVFGVVVPQGVLHSKEAKNIRTRLLVDFEIREVCLFADKVFEEGDAESAVILGRRQIRTTGRKLLTYRRIREDSIERFATDYSVDSEHVVSMNQFDADPDKSFRVPDLPEVWAHLSHNPRLDSVATSGQGFSFEAKGLIAKARTRGKRKTVDAVPAFLAGVGELSIRQLPEEVWVSESRTPVLTWRSGGYSGKPQVLVNYSPVTRGPWRIKALLDPAGRAVTNTYTTVRPHDGGPSAIFLWAVLNSPLANAFVYCNALKRHIYDTLIGSFRLPNRWKGHHAAVVAAASEYLRLVQGPEDFKLQGEDDSATCEALLKMDAAVLKAYGLPIRLERSVLDLFRVPSGKLTSRRRKGVDCAFGNYFPPNFDSLVPLHKFVSSDYKRSTIGGVAARMKPGASATVLATLRAASDAFGEEP